MQNIVLKVDGIIIPESDLPFYAIRFAFKDDTLEPSLYIHGKRTVLPWHLTMDIDHPGGGDSSG